MGGFFECHTPSWPIGACVTDSSGVFSLTLWLSMSRWAKMHDIIRSHYLMQAAQNFLGSLVHYLHYVRIAHLNKILTTIPTTPHNWNVVLPVAHNALYYLFFGSDPLWTCLLCVSSAAIRSRGSI